MKYELELEKGMNPDIGSMLNQENQENLEIFARFFGTGFNEYIFTTGEIPSGTYIEEYLQNATKFYSRLIELNPEKNEYKDELANVYYKLCWHFLLKNSNEKALESASMINKIEPLNDYGKIAQIFCYLLDSKPNKAYKISDKYKLQHRDSQISYSDFFKSETELLLEYKQDNKDLKSYLEYLGKK